MVGTGNDLGNNTMCNQAQMCCGVIADKGKLLRDQERVVAAFDELDRRQDEFTDDVNGLEKAFEELRQAVSFLRNS